MSKVIITTKSGTWFGPYASIEEARNAKRALSKTGDSLGILWPNKNTYIQKVDFVEDLNGRITICPLAD